MSTLDLPPQDDEPPYRLHRITAGRSHDNPLPPPPEGRTLRRIWTLIDEAALHRIGPEHNVSAFLEDRIHDYQVSPTGQLYFYSRVVEPHTEVTVVLDYETDHERTLRRKAMATRANATAATPINATPPASVRRPKI